MNTSRRLFSVMFLVLLFSQVSPAQGVTRTRAQCEQLSLPVALAPGEAATERVYGELCRPTGSWPGIVQLLVPGSTYGHLYWDFARQPEQYSFVRAQNRAGMATFNYDRLGSGRSTYPPSWRLTVATDTFVVHQLVQQLRSGVDEHRGFGRVIAVGHSHGSILALRAAATYHDVDALVITGLTHNVNTASLAQAEATAVPASSEARFADRHADAGYITYGPAFRQHWIHDPTADPDIVAADEATKETQSEIDEQSEDSFGFDILADPALGSTIDVPVLLADGAHDLFFCAQPVTDPTAGTGTAGSDCSGPAALVAGERPYFAPSTRIDAYIVPGAGHAINLERGAADWFAAAARWLRAVVAPVAVAVAESPRTDERVPEEFGDLASDSETIDIPVGGGTTFVRADVYVPTSGGRYPVVVMSPGGFDTKADFANWARRLASRGLVVVVADRRGASSALDDGTASPAANDTYPGRSLPPAVPAPVACSGRPDSDSL